MSSKGPIRKPPPRRAIRSICSCEAIRWPSSRSASRVNGRATRLATNPIRSAARIGSRPIARATSSTAASVSAEVWSAATTSTRRIAAGGLKKCIPQTRSGRSRPAAIAVTDRDDVLVARIASGPHRPARPARRPRFSSRSSGAASITRSQPARPPRSGASFSRAAAAFASSALHRPRSAPRASASRSIVTPASRAAGSGSCRCVSNRPRQASWAIPAPIVPAPATPIRPILTSPPRVRPRPRRGLSRSRRRPARPRPTARPRQSLESRPGDEWEDPNRSAWTAARVDRPRLSLPRRAGSCTGVGHDHQGAPCRRSGLVRPRVRPQVRAARRRQGAGPDARNSGRRRRFHADRAQPHSTNRRAPGLGDRPANPGARGHRGVQTGTRRERSASRTPSTTTSAGSPTAGRRPTTTSSSTPRNIRSRASGA